MSNFDKLKIDCAKEEDITISVVEPKKKEVNLPEKRPTIFSVLLASLKHDTVYLQRANKRKALPDFKYTFLILLSFILLAVLCLVINLTALPVKVIPLLWFLLPACMSVLFIVFYVELGMGKKINMFHVFFSFISGIIIYFLIDFISDLLFSLISNQLFNQMILPVFFALFAFFFTFLLCSFFKTTAMGECLVIAASVSFGFYFISAIVNSFNDLFIVDGTITTGSFIAPPGAGIIINNSEYLKNNLSSMLSDWLFDYFALPYLYACWSAVVGVLVSFAAESKKEKRDAPKTIYLLLMLVILLNVIAVMDTTINYLSLILKIASIVGSTLIAVVFLNVYIQEE